MSGRPAGCASPLTACTGRSSRRPVLTRAVLPGPVVPARRPGQLQRGPLVLRDHGRGVDGGRGVVGAHGQRLVGPGGHRRMAIGQGPARDPVRVLGLILAGRLGARDELHVGPELLAADLDDVVGFLAQRPGDGPVAVHGDVHQGDPQAQILHVGDDLGQVLFRADDQRIGDGVVAGQRGQVPVDLGFHALPAAGADLRHPQLDAGQVGQGVLFGGAAPVDRGLVPVAAQQRQAGPLPGQPAHELQQPLVVPGDRFAAAGSVHGHGTIREHVACVNEQRAAIHGPTVLPSAPHPPRGDLGAVASFSGPIRT